MPSMLTPGSLGLPRHSVAMDDVNFKPGVAQVAQVITSVAQVVLPDLEATETCIFWVDNGMIMSMDWF